MIGYLTRLLHWHLHWVQMWSFALSCLFYGSKHCYSLHDNWVDTSCPTEPTPFPGQWRLHLAEELFPLHTERRLSVLETVGLDGNSITRCLVYLVKPLNVHNGELAPDIRRHKTVLGKPSTIAQAFAEILAGAADAAFSLSVVKSAPRGVLLQLHESNIAVDNATLEQLQLENCLPARPCIYGALMGFLGSELVSSKSDSFKGMVESGLYSKASTQRADFIDSLCKVSLLDALTSNFDRSPANCFWESKGKLFALDNGAGFYKHFKAIEMLLRPAAFHKCLVDLSKEQMARLTGCRRLLITRDILFSRNISEARQVLKLVLRNDPVLQLVSCRSQTGNNRPCRVENLLGPAYTLFFQTALKGNMSKYIRLHDKTCNLNSLELVLDYFEHRWSELKTSVKILLKKNGCHHKFLWISIADEDNWFFFFFVDNATCSCFLVALRKNKRIDSVDYNIGLENLVRSIIASC